MEWKEHKSINRKNPNAPMVMCLVHNMFFCSKMRIYIITHINFIFFFADTLQQTHGG